jgi:hypothetical protein
VVFKPTLVIQKNSALQDPEKPAVYLMLHDFTDTTSLAERPVSFDIVISTRLQNWDNHSFSPSRWEIVI